MKNKLIFWLEECYRICLSKKFNFVCVGGGGEGLALYLNVNVRWKKKISRILFITHSFHTLISFTLSHILQFFFSHCDGTFYLDS